jgi:hypothetical protein
MTHNRGFPFFLIALAMLATIPPGYAQSRPSDAEIAALLRAGGHVIVIRHGATFPDQADTDPLNTDNIAKQRQLNPKGEDAAKALGAAFKQIGVPVGKVTTSQFNRAYQTAKLAGFDNAEKSVDVTEGGQVVSPNENNRRTAAFRKLASSPPPGGTNVLVEQTSSSSRTSPTSSTPSARIGSRSRKARPPFSSRMARPTRSSPAY